MLPILFKLFICFLINPHIQFIYNILRYYSILIRTYTERQGKKPEERWKRGCGLPEVWGSTGGCNEGRHACSIQWLRICVHVHKTNATRITIPYQYRAGEFLYTHNLVVTKMCTCAWLAWLCKMSFMCLQCGQGLLIFAAVSCLILMRLTSCTFPHRLLTSLSLQY